MAVDEKDVEEEGSSPKPKKGGNFLIVLLLVVNLLLVGGMGAYFILFGGMGKGGSNAGELEGAQETGAEEVKEEVSDKLGTIVQLEPFLVNLDEPGTNRYLKAVIQLEVAAKETEEEVKLRAVPLRDLVITYLSSLNYSQTQGVVNKEVIRTALIKQISNLLKTGSVKNLYFTEFVIQ